MHRETTFPNRSNPETHMTHDIPDFKTRLRLALAEMDTGPSPEALFKAPLLDH